MQHELVDFSWSELSFGTAFLAAGTAAARHAADSALLTP
jgi:hypothetical protein